MATLTPSAPAKRLSTWTMTREAITVGVDVGEKFIGRLRGTDITRFRCDGRRFVALSHPDYVDHGLHQDRLKYVKPPEYEPVRAGAGINLLTDEGDSWAAHRGVLNPAFSRRHLGELVDSMIDPIEDVTTALAADVGLDMHETMVEATLLMAATVRQRFTFDLMPGHPVELEATLTLRPKHGVHMMGRRRP
jgi:cytochrome P450